VKITELLDKEPLLILLFFLLGAASDVWKIYGYPHEDLKGISNTIQGINTERRVKIIFLLRLNIMKGGQEHD
jgi:hypothetical protein